ncbi:N-acetylmannosamine-6-phosphate 2-epimerase [Erysipelothrix rhusiopathiae]|uniref:N-acetylmannosamine-6-phosphate 2-epimerase n=1 Tax=Erysipelothrix rhusiopathiae TaxID=1648 RepID=UPI000F45AB1C|nr:N-acetylmannosamine-6-phosphate 2-epimerase [Erysipelothrix rhusiopathiae]MDE8256160.1 N-acetylmannosamine-6-phosphate 2-epimerase [Erysipelothrix rhusiopathiae]MDE8316010.1 N-acetylmannosamine-6-phosphate 2-epimerase [Erysipelothrix rhusiopathiae]MDE8325799.1 N-acetylmannosamine-6-phosphate 2-epimerase [Erysipelothrix rhusiopathiae]MDE8340648.1 N-acetylmannosamine-6-phosphate 2-epimerase [Erysipelothrix rhusiopathiae]RNM28439.1 N-acetylmannosamine-6-phosphate 2-epimerase [Erysipelothrix rh
MLEAVKGGLIVSCQALDGEPLQSSMIMGRMAIAAKAAGAVGIRAQGVNDINEIKKTVDLPVIGIIKENYEGSEVFITATHQEVEALLETECEMIALDATNRVRPMGVKTEDLVKQIHDGGRLAMADCSTLEEVIEAERIGFDCVSCTLAGYTSYSKNVDGPDFELVEKMVQSVKVPVIAEGKIHYPEQLKRIMDLKVHSAVVGGAITRPQEIATRFIEAIKEK